MRRRLLTTGRRALGAATALLAIPVLALPASAASDIDGGLWYYTATGMEAVHQTTTGEGVQIALINSLVNPDVPDLVGTTLDVREPAYCAEQEGGTALAAASSAPAARHGTSIASMLVGNGSGIAGEPGVRGIAPGATVVAYAVTGLDEESCPTIGGSTGRDQAFEDAVTDGADIIVVPGSISLDINDYTAAIRAGVIVVGAGGNSGLTVSAWPAALNGAIATGTVGPGAVLDPGSSSGEHLGVVAPGTDIRSVDPTFTGYGVSTGSSNSSAYTAGALALLWSLHPDATSNQILQALVHTTDGSDHEPRWDENYGFGSVHVQQLVGTDPASFPDENPFISDGAEEIPTADELLAATSEPGASPSASSPSDTSSDSGPGSEAEDASSGPSGTTVALIAAAALVLVALVVSATVVARRRKGSTSRTDDLQHGGQHG